MDFEFLYILYMIKCFSFSFHILSLLLNTASKMIAFYFGIYCHTVRED